MEPPDRQPLRILIATDAAREGLNLQAHCWHLFHFDLPWNPSRLEQRNGRIDRKLQPNPEVFCHYFVYTQRPEDSVLKALVRKTETIRLELGSVSEVVEKRLGVKLFVLDYVQLVEQEGGNGDRQRELTIISKKIMALKKQLRIPWLVLAQMNRNIETAERERKPVLSDLKDCGALEQDCDLAMFTYKTPRRDLEAAKEGQMSDQQILDAIIERKKLPDGKPLPWSMWPYRVDIVVPKYRFGPTGEAHMVFCKNLCKFEDWHLYKVAHGMEERNAGESRHLG